MNSSKYINFKFIILFSWIFQQKSFQLNKISFNIYQIVMKFFTKFVAFHLNLDSNSKDINENMDLYYYLMLKTSDKSLYESNRMIVCLCVCSKGSRLL